MTLRLPISIFRRLGLPILVVALLALPLALMAGTVRVVIEKGVSLDDAGRDLRRALNAYEAAQTGGIPDGWTRLDLATGRSTKLGRDLFVVLLTGGAEHRVMVVDAQGPHEATVVQGREASAGPLSFMLVKPADSYAGGTAAFLIRGADARPVLEDKKNEGSLTKIEGEEEPEALVVTSPDPDALKFAERFLKEFNAGRPAEECARAARTAAPLKAISAVPGTDESAARRDYTDPTNFTLPENSEDPYSAVVTLRLVRGDTESIGELSTTMRYTNQGRVPKDPRVQARTGPDGGTVEYGSPGDRFRAKLEVLEKNGKIDTESQTILRVPLGGSSDFNLQGGGKLVEATISATRSGRDGVRLELDNRSGDWGVLGTVTTTARVRNGQTVLLARNTYSRQSESSSGVPILSGVPWVGPVFGSQSRSKQTQDYALFATVELD